MKDFIRQGTLRLDDVLPYAINRMAFKMNARLKSDLKGLSLGIPQWRILAVLANEGSSNIKMLVDYTMVEQSTLSKMIDRMISDGYIVRDVDDNDARSRTISLTTSGLEKYKIAFALVEAHSRRVVVGMTPSEISKLTKLVNKMLTNLDHPL